MTRRSFLLAFTALLVAGSLSLLRAAPPSAPVLKSAGYIDVPGPKGQRFDYLTIDASRRYLFSTHLGAGLLYVIDLDSQRVIKTISDLPGIEGVEIAPDVKKVYTSDWHENKIAVVSLDSLAVIKKLPTEAKPDGIAYAAPFHKLYVSDERGNAVAVVDTINDKIVRHMLFDSETGNVRYDPVSRRVLVNLQDRNVIAEIDPTKDREVARYPVGTCRGNHGMALDPEHRLAFLACEENDQMTVFDLAAHKPVRDFPLPDGADVIAYDAGLRRIYVACYSGAISIFQADDAQHIRKLDDVPVERKVHSLAIDPRTHKVYLPEQEANGRPAARIAIFDAQ